MPKKLSQQVCEACGQNFFPAKNIPGPSTKEWNSTNIQTIHIHVNKLMILFITCNSCKRYVVVTYRSLIFTSCKKHVSYTCNSVELIQIGTEQLRNKQIFIYFSYCIFISLLSAIFITNLANYYINPPFWIDLCSNLNQNWQCQQVCNIYYSYNYRSWL